MATDWFRQWYDAWNRHDSEAVAEMTAEDVIYEDLAVCKVMKGRDEMRKLVQRSHNFSSDFRLLSVSTQQTGNLYASEWEMSGTNTGPLGPLPATNKPYLIRGISVGSLDSSGRIEANRDYWNMADFLTQVGLMPGPTTGGRGE